MCTGPSSKDKHAKANDKVNRTAYEKGGYEPPGLPPVDVGWLDTREEAGLAPPPKEPAGVQRILSPSPTQKSKGKAQAFKKGGVTLDRQLSQADWMKVYEAYRRVGTPAGLVRDTGLQEKQVNHLLEHGVRRLGLPPIREHALDLAEINVRMQEMGGDPGTARTEDNFKLNLPEVQEAVIDRASKEAAGAQVLLESTMAASAVYSAFVNEIGKIIADPDKGFSLPEKVGPKMLKALVETGDKLASSLDRAVRLSRLTAGEPESNVAIEVGIMVARLDIDAKRRFAETGQVPPEIRGRLAAGKMVDAEANMIGDDDEG
jgi:hypothetical protein